MTDNLKKYKQIFSDYKELAIYTGDKENVNDLAKIVIYAVCSFASLVLSVLNFIDGYTPMLYSTVILSVGMAIAVFLIKIKKTNLADVLAATMAAIMFSIYALTGANDGFAILWILIMPPIMTSINRKVGIYLSAYLLVFTFVICYSPIRESLKVYTATFLERFPLLCLLDFFITLYIWFKYNLSEKQLAIKTYVDELTGVYNRSFYNRLCEYIDKNGMIKDVIVVSMDINGLKTVNDEKGHVAGDALIKGAASIISHVSNKTVAVCRIGGDEFVAVIKCQKSEISEIERKFLDLQANWRNKDINHISISYGFACGADHPDTTVENLYKIADDNMYNNKTNYYVSNKIDRRRENRRCNGDRREKDLLKG